ncbi:MAG TPA: putative quinol monooxygenase [Thermoanaerobaculia bacterium]|nr:putative quinol monooxygenase [Thermoanaerobaculia bacterium]
MTDPHDRDRPAAGAPPTRRQALAAGAAGVTAALFGFTRPAVAQGDPAQRIVQTARFKLNAEKAEEGLAAMRQLTEAVEANEPGVLAYLAYRSQTDPTDVFFFEIYADPEALAAHGQTPHIGELRTLFGAGVFQPPFEVVRMDPVGGFYRG